MAVKEESQQSSQSSQLSRADGAPVIPPPLLTIFSLLYSLSFPFSCLSSLPSSYFLHGPLPLFPLMFLLPLSSLFLLLTLPPPLIPMCGEHAVFSRLACAVSLLACLFSSSSLHSPGRDGVYLPRQLAAMKHKHRNKATLPNS